MGWSDLVNTEVRVPGYAIALGAGAAMLYVVSVKKRVNSQQQLDKAEVRDTFTFDQNGDRKAYCRCWKSAKFPFCDGSHVAHNKEQGDNVGPVVIRRLPEGK